MQPARRLVATALLLLAGVGACGRPVAPPSGQSSVVRDSAGVSIVENAAPAWGDAERWKVVGPVTTIGGSEEPGGQLYLVQGATRLSDGTVAVADGGTGEIRLFDPRGRFVRSVGGVGGGPGEFRTEDGPGLRFLTHVNGDTLLAWDVLSQRTSVFSPEGDFVRSARLRGAARRYFLKGILKDRSLITALVDPADVPEGGVGGGRQVERLVRFGASGEALSVIGDFPGEESYGSVVETGVDLRLTPPWGRSLHVAVAGERVYVATGDSWEVAVYDGGGELQTLIRRASPAVPLTPELARDLTEGATQEVVSKAPEGMKKALGQAVARALADIPRPQTLPPYGSLLVDADLNLWVEAFAPAPGEATEWSVFRNGGMWLGTVTLPRGLEPLEIGTDYVLGKEQDALGVERVVVYSLDKGEA